jgi:hypothetical protein
MGQLNDIFRIMKQHRENMKKRKELNVREEDQELLKGVLLKEELLKGVLLKGVLLKGVLLKGVLLKEELLKEGELLGCLPIEW